MRLTSPLFAGTTFQTRQKPSPLAQSPYFASGSLTARKALASDTASFSVTHQNQPRFGAWNDLHTAVYDSNNSASDSNLRHQLRNVTLEQLNEEDEDGCTPLHIAASHGFYHVVRLLLAKSGIDTTARDFVDNQTAKEMAEGVEDEADRARTISEFTKKGL